MKRISTSLCIAITSLFLLALAACESDDGNGGGGGSDTQGGSDTAQTADTHDDEDPLAAAAEDGCVHLQTGPFEAVTAGGAADETAPTVAVGHLTHTVTLAADGSAGYVQLTVAEDAEYLFAATRAVTLAVQGADGTPLAAEETPDLSEHCAAIVSAWVFDLAPGTYYVSLQSAAESELDLYVNELGEHAHEDGETHGDDGDEHDDE